MAKRIHIFGGPGTGKSYLGRELSKLLKIPYTNLDKLYYSNKKQRDKAFQRVISKKEWIIEGHWYDWVKQGFAKSDKIIFLDMGLCRRDLNLFKKLIKRIFNLEKGRKLNFVDFLEMIELNHKWDRNKAGSAIRRYRSKTMVFDRADKAIAFIKKSFPQSL
jgi:adenylate kinase family enzyme